MESHSQDEASLPVSQEEGTLSSKFAYAIEVVISQSRWLVLPFLFGLIIGVFALFVTFAVKLGALLEHVWTATQDEVIVSILKLVDVFLTANLLLIVIGASYMNSVARVFNKANWPPALIGIGFSNLKQKLLGSIMAIAAVNALEWFMDIDRNVESAKLVWVVGLLLAFALSMVMLAIADRIGDSHHRK